MVKPQSDRTSIWKIRRGRDTRNEKCKEKTMGGHSEKVAVCKPRRGLTKTKPTNAVILHFQPPEL